MFYQHTPPENPKSRFPVQGKYITFGKLKSTFQFVKLYIANNKNVFHFLCISAHGLIQANCLSGYTHNPCKLCASGLIRWKLIPTHESETLFVYEPIKSETYSLMPCSSSNLGFFFIKVLLTNNILEENAVYCNIHMYTLINFQSFIMAFHS